MHFENTVELNGKRGRIADLHSAAGSWLKRMPHIHRLLLENILRRAGDDAPRAMKALLDWQKTGRSEDEIPFWPGRVLMHDTTCGPALVDIAAMRSVLWECGSDPTRLSPVLRVDVSTDHSLAVDAYALPDAFQQNLAKEYQRNAERYRLMKWAAQTMGSMRVHPPGTGIMHTINLERLATVVEDLEGWFFPDTMIGTDSHTPMVNGIGVLGWGVGGIEAEGAMFGMPLTLRVPDVVGVYLTGNMPEGVTATDLALTVTEQLRRIELTDRFVEFFGPGVSFLSAGDRAVVANMTPEFGANSGFFPVDVRTLRYLADTGRDPSHVALVEAYCRRQGLWFDPEAQPRYTQVVSLDLSEVRVSVAGPLRPQDRMSASATHSAVAGLLGHGVCPNEGEAPDGAIAIAAITSCTNTSDPRLLIAAGLVARKARALGLTPPAWVKTSLAPGSPTAERLLKRAGLLEDLEAVGFGIVGYGCTTCIGNSGPLPQAAVRAQAEGRLQVAVLSGNRNFPGRVHPQLEVGFLASPPLVVAFALAGDVTRDILTDEIAPGVLLSDLWPSGAEIDGALAVGQDPSDFGAAYAEAEASALWRNLDAPDGALYPWDPASTYIRRPPFVQSGGGAGIQPFVASPLLVLGDDITTDHISPAGATQASSHAGEWLIAHGEDPADLNVYASRRGNWEVMLRGLFTNRSVRNLLSPGIAAGETQMPSGEYLPLWQAAQRHNDQGNSVVIVAGERYGMGSSRDWAAKGVALLGVRAVLARSFERIHRTNLIGMGVLPLRFPAEMEPEMFGLVASDRIEIVIHSEQLAPRCSLPVVLHRSDGSLTQFNSIAAVETSHEVQMLLRGGMIPMVLARAAIRA